MKKILRYLNLIGVGLKRSVERFPETLFLTLVLVVMFILRVHMSFGNGVSNSVDKWLFALVLGIPIFASAKLIVERMDLSNQLRIAVNLVAAILVIAFRFTIPDNMTDYFMMRYFALFFMFFIGFLMIPYFYTRKGLSQYILYMAGRFFLMILYSGVIFGGVVMMVFTIESLFELRITEKIYIDLFIMVSGLFGVTFYLGAVPEKNKENAYSKVFKTLFLYILTPIISIYLVILYAYFIKILIEFSLPKGLIGNLVVWHAVVSVSTLFFVRDLRDEIPWVNKFIRTYIPLMIVPMIMLFLAMGIRIDAYGVTMPRYFVVALAIFSTLGMMIMRVFKSDTAVPLTILLITFIGLSFFGPLSGYAVTLDDQSNRLEAMLYEYELMDNAGNLIANADLSEVQKKDVSNQIQFLMRNYDMEDVEILPNDFNSQTALSYLGFELYGYWYGDTLERTYFNVGGKENSSVMNVENTQYLLLADYYTVFDHVELMDGIKVSKTEQEPNLKFIRDGEVIAEIDMTEAAVEYYLDQNKFPSYEYKFDSLSKTLGIELEFRSLGGYTENETDYTVNYFDVWIHVGITK